MPREVGEWSKDKLKILSQYLPVYLQATKRALERIYIDGFAGPGLNNIKGTGELIDGSPLIAASARSVNGTMFSRLFFIEKDRRAADELRAELRMRGLADRTTVIEGDVNDKLPRLVQTLPRRSPTFVFLDTEGIEPRWETIAAMAPWQTELLINFPDGMAINRNPNSPKVAAYFGTEGWRQIWDASRPGEVRALLDLYKERLRRLGYKYTTDADPVVTATRGQRLYHLVFVSKVEPARRIMKWVQDQPGSAGQLRFKFDSG